MVGAAGTSLSDITYGSPIGDFGSPAGTIRSPTGNFGSLTGNFGSHAGNFGSSATRDGERENRIVVGLDYGTTATGESSCMLAR